MRTFTEALDTQVPGSHVLQNLLALHTPFLFFTLQSFPIVLFCTFKTPYKWYCNTSICNLLLLFCTSLGLLQVHLRIHSTAVNMKELVCFITGMKLKRSSALRSTTDRTCSLPSTTLPRSSYPHDVCACG